MMLWGVVNMIEEFNTNFIGHRKLLLQEFNKLNKQKVFLNKKLKRIQEELNTWDKVLLYKEE